MDEKNKQLLDQILKYAAERKIQIPADIVLKLSTIYAEDLYSELKQGQAPSEMEGKILMGTLRKLVEQIVLEEIPEFGLMNPGLVPAPGRSGLMLMSTGWKPYLMPSAPGGGGGGTGISDAPGDSQSYVRYNRTWIVMPPGVTQHSLLTGLDYASAGHTGFQPTLTGAATLALLLPVDGAGSLLDADLLDGNEATAFALTGHNHAGVYLPTAGAGDIYTHNAAEFQTALAFPLAANLGGTGIANAVGSTLTLAAATSITGGGTLGLGGFTGAVPATGTFAMGAGTLTSATINDVTGANHTHAITASTALVAAGTAQYQVLTTGANPYPAGWSGFYLDGTTGGKTILAVTNTKTLTLTSTGDYNVTFPATDTVAMLGVANIFTINQTINCNNATALLVEQDGVKDNVLIVDTTNGRVGINTVPSYTLNVYESYAPAGDSSYTFSKFDWVCSPTAGTNYIIIGLHNSLYKGGSQSLTSVSTTFKGILTEIGTLASAAGNVRRFIGAEYYVNILQTTAATFSTVTGLNYRINLSGAAHTVTVYYGFSVSNPALGSGSTIGTNYALYVQNQTTASTNYAIYTEKGLCRFGDQLSIVGSADRQQLIVTGFTTQAVATPMAQITRNDTTAGISAMLGLTALGNGVNGNGGSILYNGKTSTTAATAMGLDQFLWVNATHASRTARRVFNVYDTAIREVIRIEASGTEAMIGFLGAAAVVRPLATADLGVALSDLGLRVAGTAYPITTSGAVSFTGGVTTSGGRVEGVTTYTDTCNILTTDECVIFNKATAFTATMPAAIVGQRFYFKNIGVGNVTLSFPGTDTVDEVDDDLIMTQYDSYTLICRLANKWVKV